MQRRTLRRPPCYYGLDLKRFDGWLKPSAVAEKQPSPAPGALAPRLFDVVIVVAEQAPRCGNKIDPNRVGRQTIGLFPFVYCSAMRFMAGRGFEFARVCDSYQLSCIALCFYLANTLVDYGQSFDRVPTRCGKGNGKTARLLFSDQLQACASIS